MEREHASYTSSSQQSTSSCKSDTKGTKAPLTSAAAAPAPSHTAVTLPKLSSNYFIKREIKSQARAVQEGSKYKSKNSVGAGLVEHSHARSGISTEAFSRSASSSYLRQTYRTASLPVTTALEELSNSTAPSDQHSLRCPLQVFNSSDLREASRFRPLSEEFTALRLAQPMEELLPFAEQRRLYGESRYTEFIYVLFAVLKRLSSNK